MAQTSGETIVSSGVVQTLSLSSLLVDQIGYINSAGSFTFPRGGYAFEYCFAERNTVANITASHHVINVNGSSLNETNAGGFTFGTGANCQRLNGSLMGYAYLSSTDVVTFTTQVTFASGTCDVRGTIKVTKIAM